MGYDTALGKCALECTCKLSQFLRIPSHFVDLEIQHKLGACKKTHCHKIIKKRLKGENRNISIIL